MNPAEPDPSLAGLGPLDREIADTMASEGGRSSGRVAPARRPLEKWGWLAIGVLAMLAARRLARRL